MKKKMNAINILLVFMFFAASCNLPSSQDAEGVSLTAAAQTIQALTSATPGLPVPTFTSISGFTSTPLPTLTVLTSTPAASPTSNCNVAQFVADVTIPDGTIVTPGQSFTKKWRLKNIGSCTWSGFTMTFDSGDSMGGPASKPVSTVNPGQEVDLELALTAPSTVGNYRGYWRILTSGGVLVPVVNGYQGKSFYVDIKVQNPATATATNTAPVVFAVTSVNFNVTGTCPNFNYTVTVTVNAAGTVNLHRVFSDGATDTTPRTLTFSAAGSQSFSEPVYYGVPASSSWTDIYIDSPNHQQFGRATFTCP
jgi:hypothetical protein